jgi:hypothetical protein
MNWDRLANEVELVYGGYVDHDEEFFICPECDEPIYKCDWNDSDFALGRPYRGRLRLYCPVCEAKLIDEGEEFN